MTEEQNKLAEEIERILTEYHRAVELDDASLLPKIMSQWCDLFFKPGASAILAAMKAKQEYEYNCQVEGKPCDRWCGANPCLAEHEPATEAVLEMAAKVAIRMADAASARLQQSHDDDAAAQFDTANEIAEAIRALKGKGASQGVGEMSEIREVLEWTRALLRNIVKASPEVRKHTDVEAFILNEINPSLALCARITCVPTIPTKAMIKAGRDATKYASGGTVETIYRAMLAASPDEQKDKP